MTFTDDELTRLKAHEGYQFTKMNPGQSKTWAFVDSAKIDALLARLEAAERLCRHVHKYFNPTDYGQRLYRAWRKAAGK